MYRKSDNRWGDVLSSCIFRLRWFYFYTRRRLEPKLYCSTRKFSFLFFESSAHERFIRTKSPATPECVPQNRAAVCALLRRNRVPFDVERFGIFRFVFYSRCAVGGRGRARMVGTRRGDPVRRGRKTAVHATVGPQLAAGWQDHQVVADKRDHRDAGKSEPFDKRIIVIVNIRIGFHTKPIVRFFFLSIMYR